MSVNGLHLASCAIQQARVWFTRRRAANEPLIFRAIDTLNLASPTAQKNFKRLEEHKVNRIALNSLTAFCSPCNG